MRQLKITKQVTNRESKSLNTYLQDVSKLDMITADEEVELAQRIREGDQVALERLTKANLRFVVSVAKQYQNQGLKLPDLINEGNVGLVKAAKRFDETRGFKFISYAVWWIRQSILQAISEHSRTVRVAKVKLAMKNSGRNLSMDAPFKEGENDSNLYDVLKSGESPNPDADLMQESLGTEIERALETLSHRESDVIKLNYGLGGEQPHTLQEIGEMFDLSRERVRQIREKGIRRLRHTSRSKVLKTYLG